MKDTTFLDTYHGRIEVRNGAKLVDFYLSENPIEVTVAPSDNKPRESSYQPRKLAYVKKKN